MKRLKIYFDKIWKGFEAPEKPFEPPQYIDTSGGLHFEIGGDIFGYEKKLEKWKKAYAAARAAALPIINPEVISEQYPTGLDRLMTGKEWVWPGTMEMKTYSCNNKLKENEVACPQSAIEFPDCCGSGKCYVLSLPAKETSRDQIAKILRDNITFSGQVGDYVIHGAIDKIIEYGDHRLSDFKKKLAGVLVAKGFSRNDYNGKILFETIDQL